MADEKVTALPELTDVADDDYVHIVDTSDTTDDPAGSSKKAAVSNLRGAAAPAGGKTLIETITLATAGEFDFDNIPQIYSRLIVQGSVRSDATSTHDSLHMIFNADTVSTNYHYSRHYMANGSHASDKGNTPGIGFCAAANSVSGGSTLDMKMEGYSDSVVQKNITATSNVSRLAGDQLVGDFYLSHPTLAAAVDRVRIRADNHPADGLIGTLHLYGEM